MASRVALALLLLALASPSIAEEEPKASAPLPPPLPAAPQAAQASNPDQPQTRPQRHPAAIRHRTPRARKHAAKPAITTPKPGLLSRPADQESTRRADSAAIPVAPPPDGLTYYPEYPGRLPAPGYVPRYPYRWPAPGAEPFRWGFRLQGRSLAH